MMWEYTMLEVTHADLKDDLVFINLLNKHGRAGWETTSFTQDDTHSVKILMKRGTRIQTKKGPGPNKKDVR